MPWGVAVAAVGAVAAADSASKGSYAQRKAAADANELSRSQFNQSREDQLPWMDRGNVAGNRLQYLMGLSPTGGAASYGGQTAASFVPKTEQQFRNEMLEQYTSGTTYDGGYFDAMDGIWRGDRGIKQGTVDEAGLQAAIQKAMQAQTEYQAGLTAAEKAAAEARANDPNFGSFLRTFGKEDLDKDIVYQNGWQFGLDEGRKGVNNQLAATGNMLSGKALKALTRFGNDYATTKTNDAYNRFNNNQTQIYNRLAGISGTGQTGANQIANQSAYMANNVSKNMIDVGNARGASAIAKGNALTGAIGQGYNAYQQNQLMRNPSGYDSNAWGAGYNPYGGYDAGANGGWGIE